MFSLEIADGKLRGIVTCRNPFALRMDGSRTCSRSQSGMYARALKKSLKIDLALKLSQSRTNLYEFLFAGPRRTSPKLGGKKKSR